MAFDDGSARDGLRGADADADASLVYTWLPSRRPPAAQRLYSRLIADDWLYTHDQNAVLLKIFAAALLPFETSALRAAALKV